MTGETLYIPCDMLAAIMADGRVAGMTLSSSEGKGMLSLQVKAGSVEGISAAAGETRLDLLFAPSHLCARWKDEDGVCEAQFYGDDCPHILEELLMQPLQLPRLARRLMVLQTSAEQRLADLKGPQFSAQTILMLLRHTAVSDLLFGSDGREATLQFQITNGYAGVDDRPPQDWIGIDFTERGADLSWFDRNGVFQSLWFAAAGDEQALRTLCMDPLGCVLREGQEMCVGQGEADFRNLMRMLHQNYSGLKSP